MNEIWKDIEGYEGLYQVSNTAKVKELNYKGNERLIPQNYQSSGYIYVALKKDKKQKNFLVHRLVALHFIPNALNKPQVNHIVPDKSINDVTNLEWVTIEENMQHAISLGLMNTHKKPQQRKRKQTDIGIENEIDVCNMRLQGISHKDISKKYVITQYTVRCILKKHNIKYKPVINLSEEEIKNRSERATKVFKGRPKSEKQKANMKVAAIKRWENELPESRVRNRTQEHSYKIKMALYKLNDVQVKEILKQWVYNKDSFSYSYFQKEFGVSRNLIVGIVQNNTYMHVNRGDI